MITHDKSEIRAHESDVPGIVVNNKQVVFFGYERNVAYDKARSMVSYIGSPENPKLPRYQEQKEEIHEERKAIDVISLNRNVALDFYGKLAFVLVCYTACVWLISDTFHWCGLCLGHLVGFVGFLTMWFDACPWVWPSFVIIPIARIVIIICAVGAWLWLSGRVSCDA